MNVFQKNRMMKLLLILLVAVCMLGLTACGGKEGQAATSKPKLILGNAGWDSFTFHNEVAKFIIENGYGYNTEVTTGSTPITYTGLKNGDIDIYMETWGTNITGYEEDLARGDVVKLSLNYGDNAQGLYVPTYVIKGDPKRGVEPMAPDLKTVKDLEKYWEIFKDEEDPSKGRIYGAIPGWEVDTILATKVKTYGLDKKFNYFSPGSDAALASSIAGAYEKGDPWLGYYWEPTWIIGQYDMTLLSDEPYNEELWNNGYACEFATVPVEVVVNKGMAEKAPDVVEFLKQYKTSSKLTSDALAYMQKNEVEPSEAAQWFLKSHQDLWTKWVEKDVAQKVKDALQ
ncbi:ABC transporter substrate-binding protein [Marinisporobacter balticus]|uniref:Glycine betaine/proline transport system substrate-binding protein n=1 Tax=Marinisporobacter balticus TaxID=2018667 RepID=A0A4R2KKX9_9FIRM|nr:ABC transporter substrate-binding protein [Marinisporobacter balticus]TCO71339.1 glycine betaine/proline transport system substrate-binding protein [Marinisporobacter balticus]